MQHQKLTKDIIDKLHQYEDIFRHHVETILKSRLLLDEDATLLLSYWDDRSTFKEDKSTTKWDVFAGCLAVAGIISSIKLRSGLGLRMYFFSLLSVPFISNMLLKGRRCFNNYKTKRDFEALVKCLKSMHELNKTAMEYFNRRDIVLVNYQFSSCGNCMNYFYCVLLKTLEEIKRDILLINKTIPVAEPYNMYVVNWDLEQFKSNDFNDYKKTLLQLEKMCDFYVLMVSNFLSCIGLSLCVNLWQSPTCNFRIIFRKVVPSRLKSLENSVNELVRQFSQLRYTLTYTKDIKTLDVSKKYAALYKPLDSLLSHLQITFEMAKLLENSLKSNQNEIGANSDIVTAVCNQFNVCNEDLHSFVQSYEIILKRSLRPAIKENDSPNESNEELNCLRDKSETNKNQDDSIENLEDEEYNLYVGYSDDEDEDDFRTSVDYVDQMPTEYLELMLTELKRKLDERKLLKEKRLNPSSEEHNPGCIIQKLDPNPNTNSEISSIECQSNLKKDEHEVAVPLSTPPPPPLPPKLKILKDNAQKVTAAQDFQQPGLQTGFLNDIKFLAQQLNRSEETFGFGSDLSDSDSDN